MTITTIDLVDTDLSTVLFDLHSSTGSTNSSWGSVITKFGLGGNLTTTAPHDPERFEHPGADGGFTTFSRRGLGEAHWRQTIAGTTEANLRLGVGRLTDLITRGTILRIVTSTTTRYLRLEPSAYPSPFQGKELELHDIFQQFAFRQGLDIAAVCQPYWEGAEVTTSGVTVPNDPATSTKVRAYPITVTGDLPTQGKVRVQMDASALAHRTTIAARARRSEASTYFSDYLSATGFAQAEATGRGWTVTLGTDTTGQVEATASPGSGTSLARVSYATVTAYDQRVTWVRSASMESLRGSWDVIVRIRSSAVSVHGMILRWGPRSSAGSAGFYLDEVQLPADVSPLWTEYSLGRIHIPDPVGLSGLFFELATSRLSGTGNLDIDFMWLMPAEHQCTMIARYDEAGTTTGARLGTSESMQTWPLVPAAYWLDSSGNLIHPLNVEGEVGVVLEPGDNHVFVRTESNTTASSIWKTSVLAATPTVTVTYAPRFAL